MQLPLVSVFSVYLISHCITLCITYLSPGTASSPPISDCVSLHPHSDLLLISLLLEAFVPQLYVPILIHPQGGSIKGTTLCRGDYGLRILASARFSSQLLSSCSEALKRKLRPIKGAQVHMRVFPHTPVCVKGNETRMGKGKGSFAFWAAKVPMGRVVFEVGGGGLREEVAKAALRLAQHRLGVPSEFITTATPARLGNISDESLRPPPVATDLAMFRTVVARGEVLSSPIASPSPAPTPSRPRAPSTPAAAI